VTANGFSRSSANGDRIWRRQKAIFSSASAGVSGRCFVPAFTETRGVLNDLREMLTRLGIEPIGQRVNPGRPEGRFTEHRTIQPTAGGSRKHPRRQKTEFI